MTNDIIYDYQYVKAFIAEGDYKPKPDGIPMDIRILSIYNSGIRAEKAKISPTIVIKLGTKLYFIFDTLGQKYFYLHKGSPRKSYPYGYVGRADRTPVLGKPFNFDSVLSFNSTRGKSFRTRNPIRMEKVLSINPVGKSFYNVKGTIRKIDGIYTISAYVKV